MPPFKGLSISELQRRRVLKDFEGAMLRYFVELRKRIIKEVGNARQSV